MDSNNSQLYFPEGSNIAPVKPFLDLKDKSLNEAEKSIGDHELTKQIKKKYEDLIAKNKDSWREMVCAGEINALFISGEQILKINTFSGMPYISKTNRNDPQHIKCVNDMQYFCTTWLDKYRSSKPDIVVSPYSNGDEAIAQARKANAVVDYLESKIYGKSKNWFDLNEGMNAQIWGWYGRRVRPDFTSKAFAIFKDILGEKEVPIGKGYGRCDCGYKGNDAKEKKVGKKNFSACPKCESLEYDYDPPIMQVTPYVKNRQKVFLPEIICEPLVFPSTRWDLSKKFEESGWAIIEREVEKSALRRIIGNIRFPEGESGNDFGLDAIEMLATRGAAMSGSSSVSEKHSDKIVITEMYLDADHLWDIRIGGEEKTVEGRTLPKGKRMSDLYDKALFLGINGMSLVLGITKEHHSDCSTSGVLHLKAGSGAGRGIGDAVEVQKQKNRRYSQIDSFMATRGTPATLMAENAIEPRYRRQLHNPRAIIPIKIQNFPEFRSLDQFLKPLQGESVPGDLVSVTFDRLREMMQTAYHITDLGGARPQGIKNDTATFAEIVDANADALFSPLLSIKADTNVETVKKAFYKWVEYTPKARFIPFKSKSKSGVVGEEISGKDVNGEYQWSYVPGSEAPKTRHTENQKRANFFSMFPGGIVEYFTVKQQFPKQIAEIERDFDVNFESDSYDDVSELCRNRWEKAKESLKGQLDMSQFGAMLGMESEPDYLQILLDLEPSFEVTEPAINEQILWYQNLLMTAEGQAMSREQRKLVSTFVVSLKELAKGQSIEQQKDDVEVQMAAQEPMVEAQNAQAQQEAGANQAQTEMQMLGEAAKVINENEQTAQAQAHEKELADQEDLMELVTAAQQENA